MNNNKFSTRQPKIIGEKEIKKYAVMVPIISKKEGFFVLFEKRSHALNVQPGEICFPGGKLEPNESLEECAIRETVEELNIDKQQIKIIGPGDIFISHYNIIIYPYLGVINDYNDTFSTEEVSDIIEIPLSYFYKQQPTSFKSKVITYPPNDFPYEWIPNGKNYIWAKGTYDILFYQYNNIIIWGITARIIHSMVALIDEHKLFNNYIMDK